MTMERTLNILVVDDEAVVLESVKKFLREEDCVVHGVKSAAEALAVMDQIQVDVVITDLMMPHMDGLELMTRIKSRGDSMPVILMTGYATINTARQATELGAFGYVAKPFTRAELKEVVQRAIKRVKEPGHEVGGESADQD
jgi:DNA-binding NtrC family response regulator